MTKYNIGVVGYGWGSGAHIATSLDQVIAVYSSSVQDSAKLSALHGSPR